MFLVRECFGKPLSKITICCSGVKAVDLWLLSSFSNHEGSLRKKATQFRFRYRKRQISKSSKLEPSVSSNTLFRHMKLFRSAQLACHSHPQVPRPTLSFLKLLLLVRVRLVLI